MKYILPNLIAIIVLFSICVSVWGQELTADLPYNNALSYLEKTDLERAYSFCQLTIKDFPNSEHAKKAKVLQVMIALSKTRHEDEMINIYRNGSEKATSDTNKKAFFNEAQRSFPELAKWLRRLIEDTNEIISMNGMHLSLEIKIESSSPYFSKMQTAKSYIDYGLFPSTLEREKLEKYQSIISLIATLTQGIKDVSLDSIISTLRAEGYINWTKLYMGIGDNLITRSTYISAALEYSTLFSDIELLSKDEIKQGHMRAIELFKLVRENLQANPYDKDYVRAGERIQEIEGVLAQPSQVKSQPEIGIKTERNTNLLHPVLWCNDKIIQDAIGLGKECWNLDRNGGYDGWGKISDSWKRSASLIGSAKIEVYAMPLSVRIANFVYNNLSQEYEATKNLENFVKIIQDALIFHIYATSDDDPNDLENIRCVLYNDKGDKYEATKIKAYDVEYKSSKYSSYYRRSWYVDFNLFDDSGIPIIAKEAKSFKLVVALGIRRAELTWDLTDLSK